MVESNKKKQQSSKQNNNNNTKNNARILKAFNQKKKEITENKNKPVLQVGDKAQWVTAFTTKPEERKFSP